MMWLEEILKTAGFDIGGSWNKSRLVSLQTYLNFGTILVFRFNNPPVLRQLTLSAAWTLWHGLFTCFANTKRSCKYRISKRLPWSHWALSQWKKGITYRNSKNLHSCVVCTFLGRRTLCSVQWNTISSAEPTFMLPMLFPTRPETIPTTKHNPCQDRFLLSSYSRT